MYCEYFKFDEKPFSLTPDPRYLYMSQQHWEAVAHLIHGVDDDWGFVLITGEVGTGKTTLCRFLLEHLPEDIEAALVINPKLTVMELLATICDEFRISYPEGNISLKVFVDLINTYLLDVHARARKALLIIDEAQCLSAEALDQLRLLTNLETNQCKLLRIILLGQPELQNTLSKSELQQVAQRITARYHLGPLSKKEVSAYVNHRLKVAGAQRPLFSASSIKKLYCLSKGIPRLINLLSDRALLGACLQNHSLVKRATLVKAAQEVFRKSNFNANRDNRIYMRWSIAAISLILLLVALIVIYSNLILKSASKSDYIQVKPAHTDRTMPDLLQKAVSWQPESQAISKSREMAYKALLKQRGFIYNSSSDITFCSDIELLGLSCINAKDNLRNINRLNPPAALKLFNSQAKEFYVTLIALNEQTATVILGDKTFKVPDRDLLSLWSGDYILLRQTTSGYKVEKKHINHKPFVQQKDR